MAKSATLAVKNKEIRHTINTFLQELLRQKIVEALLVPLELPVGNVVAQSLVTKPGYLEKADVLAPVFPVNSARLVSAITRLTPVSKKTAVVLKSCELRALIELVKLKQASLENLVLIGVDCYGTYSVKDYAQFASESTSDDFIKTAVKGEENPKLRTACQICAYPAPLTSDITIGLFGLEPEKGILLQANTEQGEEILEKLGLSNETADEMAKKRDEAVSQSLSERETKRQGFFEQTREEAGGFDKLAAIFAPCINCHNCMTVCPVCYCLECFFDSPTFDLEADRYLGMAEKKGALKMPTDILLFHLTRMSHMAASCIGCGACEEACPNDIPLLKLFQLTGDSVQKLFEYTPGRSLEDELPMSTFREDELHMIGEG